MRSHRRFALYLNRLDGGDELTAAYRSYKANKDECAFRLNGHLKVGMVMPDDLQALFGRLKEIICAYTDQEFMVYRMTSIEEFVGPLFTVAENRKFKYPAFMSTSASDTNTERFRPQSGTPLLIEISNKPWVRFAPMEGGDGLPEDEYLFGPGTSFAIKSLTPADESGIARLSLDAEGSPPYATGRGFNFNGV